MGMTSCLSDYLSHLFSVAPLPWATSMLTKARRETLYLYGLALGKERFDGIEKVGSDFGTFSSAFAPEGLDAAKLTG